MKIIFNYKCVSKLMCFDFLSLHIFCKNACKCCLGHGKKAFAMTNGHFAMEKHRRLFYANWVLNNINLNTQFTWFTYIYYAFRFFGEASMAVITSDKKKNILRNSQDVYYDTISVPKGFNFNKLL